MSHYEEFVPVERYTDNWHEFQAWPPKRNALAVMRKGLSRTLPGLENFYMAGQRAGATVGLSPAAESGRTIIKTICRQDKRQFVTGTR